MRYAEHGQGQTRIVFADENGEMGMGWWSRKGKAGRPRREKEAGAQIG